MQKAIAIFGRSTIAFLSPIHKDADMVSNISRFLRSSHTPQIVGGAVSLRVKLFDNDRDGQFFGSYTHFIGGAFNASPALRQPRSFETEQQAYEYLVSCWEATSDRFKNQVSHRQAQAA